MHRALGAALVSALLLGGGLSACSSDLTPGVALTRLRLLGVRLEVEAEPERASPAPGERVRVRPRLVAPRAMPPYGYLILACARRPIPTGADACAAPPFFLASGFHEAAEGLEVAFDVPADSDPSRGLLLAGAFCERGELDIADGAPGSPVEANGPSPADAEAVAAADVLGNIRCRSVGEAESPEAPAPPPSPQLWVLPVRLAGAEVPVGRHPAVPDDWLLLGEAPWPRTDFDEAAATEPCAERTELFEAGVRAWSVAEAGNPEIAFNYPAELRAALTPEERVVVSVAHFSNFGRLDRQFTVFADTEAADVPFDFNSTRGPNEEERLAAAGSIFVRFEFALRDPFGGFSWDTRALCLSP